MSAPMSVKERIAMMKQKEEEEKASKTKMPDPPVRRSSLSDKSTANICNNAHSSENSVTSNADVISATGPNVGGGVGHDNPPKVSIADKIAALKASNVSAQPFKSPTQTPTPVSSSEESSNPTIGERMAALRRKSVGPTDIPTPPPSTFIEKPVNKDGSDGSVSAAAPKSLAERMAALRAASAPVPVVKSNPSSLSSVFTPLPPPPASTTEATATSDTITPPKMTIAERMAALKASAAEHPSTPNDAVTGSANGTPLSTGGRRVSIGLVGLGAKINLAGLSPNAVRPPVKREVEAEAEATGENDTTTGTEDGCISPKSNRVSFNAQEDGEFRHLSLTRPAVNSIRRRNTTASLRLNSSAWESGEGFSDMSVISSAPGTPSTLNSANSSRPVSFTTKGGLDAVPDDDDEGETAEADEDEEKEKEEEAMNEEEDEEEVKQKAEPEPESEPESEPELPVSPPPPPPARRVSVAGTPPPPPPPAFVPVATASPTVPASPPQEQVKVTPPPPPVRVAAPTAVPASPPQAPPPEEPKAAAPPPPPPGVGSPPAPPAQQEPVTMVSDTAALCVPPPPPLTNNTSSTAVRHVSVVAPPPPPPPVVAEVEQSKPAPMDGEQEIMTKGIVHPPPPPPPQPINATEKEEDCCPAETSPTPSKMDPRKDPRFALL